MTIRELFEKIYNGEIKEDDVIIQISKDGEEYNRYIVNDGFDYWYHNGDEVISLSFFKKEYDEDVTSYDLISKREFLRRIEEKEKQREIKELQNRLAELMR